MNKLKEIFSYREMIHMLVKRNLRGRYKGSILGFAWTFLNPLLQLAVYTIVFSVILKSGEKFYSIFLFVALIPWIAFSGSVIDGAGCVINDAGMITKIYFPRQVLPIISTLTNYVNMLLCMIIVIIICAFTVGINLPALLCMIPIMLIEFIFSLGISFITSSICVYFRDLQYMLSIIVLAWQFLTPVMYSVNIIPEEIKWIFYLNPMTSIIVAYRDILYYKTIPGLSTLVSALLMGIVFLFAGWFIFSKLEKKFAEVL